MIAAATALRQWRAAFLAMLLLFVVVLVALVVLDERPPSDQLPLRGVPESAYASAGVVLYSSYGEEGSFGPKGAEFLARLSVCCGKPSQTVLVRLGKADSDESILAYALNYDTDKAPEAPPFGGHFVTAVTKGMDYFVAFFDAKSGELIYHLQPGGEQPFPSTGRPRSSHAQIVARNLDGPDVLVTLWTFRPETTVVECGEEEAV